MCFENYGFHPSMLPSDAEGTPARITAVHRERYAFVCGEGTGLARLKAGAYRGGNQPLPTTGDFVLIDRQAAGESRILHTLPRRSYFARRDPSGQGEQAVAANFDYVFILQSLDRDFSPRRLERYLTLSWQSGALPAVLLTKADAAGDYSAQLRAAEAAAVGCGVFAVSAETGLGLDHLGDYLKPGRTAVMLGSSGVGKSSLINALAGGEVMATGDTRGKDGRGRHTTTRRQLILLPGGAMVIDTPGMREIGLWNADEGLQGSFADIERYVGQCKFRDCRHESEPGCAVKEAVRRGELSEDHYRSYLKLRGEARFSSDKADYLREKAQWQKGIAKALRQRETIDYRQSPCAESFTCKVCGAPVSPEDAGTHHRNHCPHCLSSIHLDNRPGDRASLCRGVMDPIGVWVRKNGEWAVIHRCRSCGALSSNRIAADDNPTLLMSIALRPLASPPFPLWQMPGEAGAGNP